MKYVGQTSRSVLAKVAEPAAEALRSGQPAAAADAVAQPLLAAPPAASTSQASVTFAIYAEQEGGAALWQETQNVALDAEGRYSVLLGAASREGMPAELFATGEARWLGVRVNVPGDAAASEEQARVLKNQASGSTSFAAGRRAKAIHDGSFVWGDSTDDDVLSNGVNTFIVRAAGGIILFSSGDTVISPTGVTVAPGSSAWSMISDRNSKENFAPVDGFGLLEKLDAIPMMTWNWKAQAPSIRHMGPMAQDFRAAFGLGEEEKRISTVDADGVALAGVQALYRLLRERDAQLSVVQAHMDEMARQAEARNARLAGLECELAELRDAVAQLAGRAQAAPQDSAAPKR